MEKLLNRRNTIIFVGLLTLWRIYLSATLQLHPDEAYYWLWSRHLDFGYYDHSPLIAYFIRLTTLFSQGELWVRFSGILGAVIMSVLLWRLAMQLFGRVAIASAGVLILNIMPLTMSGSIIVTPDIPSFLFWAVSIFLAWQIVRTGKAYYWYLLGFSFGLALLSKYTAVLFAPCLFLFLLVTDERKWLRTVHPYAAFLIGIACFLPVVYWNSLHDWISFRFQMGHGLGGAQYTLKWFFEYIGGQMLMAGPFLWIFGMAGAVAYLFRPTKEKLFLSCTALPVILFFAYSSLKRPAGANWPAFAYFTFSIIAAQYLLAGGKVKKAFLVFALLFSFGMSLLVTLHARFSILPLASWNREWARADATNWFYGWKELAQEIGKYPDARFALTPSHQLSPEISYYTREKVFAYIDKKETRPSQYNLWRFPDELKKDAGLYVYFDRGRCGPYAEYFGSLQGESAITVTRRGFPVRGYHIVRGNGYLQSD